MRTALTVALTPFVWLAMLIISFLASFPLSWITAKSLTQKKAKEIVSMVNNPVV